LRAAVLLQAQLMSKGLSKSIVGLYALLLCSLLTRVDSTCAQGATATLLTTFTNPTPANSPEFGRSVAAVGSDRVLIGTPGDSTGGAAYLFSTYGTLLANFTNPTPAIGDGFGYAVAAVGNDRVLIGAWQDDTGAENAGAAYLFSTNGTLLTTFTNPTPATADWFGISVAAVGSDRVLIGAYGDDAGAVNAGAAYLFNATGGLLTTFSNPTPADFDWFGVSVAAVGSDRVLIGAHADDTGASDTGAAYLFSTNGTLLTTFTNPTPATGDWFGISVTAVGSDRVLIGAPYDNTGATHAGAAYLFSTNGTLLNPFTNPTPAFAEFFGWSVAAMGTDRVLINPSQDFESGPYLFSTNGTLLTTFTDPTPPKNRLFGISMAAVGSGHVLIGAPGEDTGGANAGAAYLYAIQGGLALPSATLTGTFVFGTDAGGSCFGNVPNVCPVWDTRTNLDSGTGYYNLWFTSGAPGRIPDGLIGPFLNGPSNNQASINVPLAFGTNRFTVFFGDGISAPYYGLNLFFNGHVNADISSFAPPRTGPSTPAFAVNASASTFGMDGTGVFPVPASGRLSYTDAEVAITLTEYYFALPNVFAVDRTAPYSARPNGNADAVVTFMLIVSPPEPSTALRLRIPWDKQGDVGVSETQYWIPQTYDDHLDEAISDNNWNEARRAVDFYFASPQSPNVCTEGATQGRDKNVRAANSGTVWRSGILLCNSREYEVIRISGQDLAGVAVTTEYIHLLPSVLNGQTVSAGDIIGSVSDRGCADLPHLMVKVYRGAPTTANLLPLDDPNAVTFEGGVVFRGQPPLACGDWLDPNRSQLGRIYRDSAMPRDATLPTVSWVTPPPANLIVGQSFTVSWSYTGNPSHLNVHWHPTDPINLTLAQTVPNSTSDSSALTTGTSQTLTAPTIHPDGSAITSPTTVRYVAHARNAAGSGFSAVVTVTVSPAASTVLYGIDVSHYQNDAGPIDWASVKASGKSFVFVKASEGTDIPDGCNHSLPGCPISDHTVENIQCATAAGLRVSPYHIASVNDSSSAGAIVEAQYFLSRIGNYIANGYLPPTLDLESMYGLNGSQLSAWVRAWLHYLQQQKPGVTPIIYTTRSVLLSLGSDLQSYPLWIADYTAFDPAATPCYQGTCWPNWKFKQYRDGGAGGTCSGVTGPVDIDSFNGDFNALNQLVIQTRLTGVGGGALQPPAGGEFRFEILAPAQQQVVIQASDDLINWIDVDTVTIVNAKAIFTDPNANAHSRRFYRSKP